MSETLTPEALRALLVTLLASATDKPEVHWYKLVRPLTPTSLATDPKTNWSLKVGGLRDREVVDRAIEVVRGEHPYVRW